MASARANRESGPRHRRGDPAPLRSALRAAMDGSGVPEVVPLGIEVQQRLVLKVLVEEFGGEVTGAALTRYLTHQLGWTSPVFGTKLIDVLQALHRSSAVCLEAQGENDFIVRLLPDGAALYA